MGFGVWGFGVGGWGLGVGVGALIPVSTFFRSGIPWGAAAGNTAGCYKTPESGSRLKCGVHPSQGTGMGFVLWSRVTEGTTQRVQSGCDLGPDPYM